MRGRGGQAGALSLCLHSGYHIVWNWLDSRSPDIWHTSGGHAASYNVLNWKYSNAVWPVNNQKVDRTEVFERRVVHVFVHNKFMDRRSNCFGT